MEPLVLGHTMTQSPVSTSWLPYSKMPLTSGGGRTRVGALSLHRHSEACPWDSHCVMVGLFLSVLLSVYFVPFTMGSKKEQGRPLSSRS